MVIVERTFYSRQDDGDHRDCNFGGTKWGLNLSILEIGPLQTRIFILATCMMRMFLLFSPNGHIFIVIDCDIRINICGTEDRRNRILTNEVEFQ